MKTNYLIWDWNGTLLNDVNLSIESINYLLAKENLPLLADKETYQSVFQFPIIRYYEKLGFDFTKRSFADLAEDYMEYYQPRSLSVSLQPHALEVLDYFQKKGYTQVLLSASDEHNLWEQLNQYPIQGYFKDVLALDNIHAHSKTDLAKTYVEKERLNMHKVTFIGDSVHDYEVASKANGDCILVANGHEHIDKLRKTGVDIVDTLQALIPLFK